MALSGSFNTSAYNNLYIEFSWTGSQSISGNYTDVAWKAVCRRSSGSGGYYAHWSIVVAGETVNSRSQSDRILITNGTTIASGTKRVYHNNDGTKSFSASISASIYTYATNCTGSGSWTLNTIPRYANPVPSLTARTETSLSITWTADGTCDQVQFSSDNGSTWTAIESINASSGSHTISGLSVNTTYQVKVKARRKDSQLTNESSAVSMTTYNYPFASTMPDFDIGSSVNIGITNPLGHTVTVELLASNNNVAFTGTTSTQTISVDPTASTLYASIPNAMSGSYKVRVTYGASVITEDGGLYNVVGSLPTAGDLTYADSNNTAVAITQDDQKIVQNISVPNYSITVQGANSATIASVSITVNGNTFNLAVSGSTATGTGGTINSASSVVATATITDSRGQTITKTVDVDMIAWNNPSAIINIARQQNFYSETDIKVDADYTQIGNSTITISVLGQAEPITGQTTPADVTASLTDNVQDTLVLDNDFAWNIAITLTDSFGGTTTYNTHVSRGIPFVMFDKHRGSMSLNQFPQHDNSLEVNGDIYADNLNANGNASIGGDADIGGDTTITGDTDVSGEITNKNVSITDLALECKNYAYIFPTIKSGSGNGLTWTIDHSDNTITINGTATADTWLAYTGSLSGDGAGADVTALQGKEMTLSIIPANCGVEAFVAFFTGSGGSYIDVQLGIVDSYTFAVPNNAARNRSGVCVPNGTSVSNVKIKLLFQETTVTDTNYVPHAMSNLELTNSLLVKRFTKAYSVTGNNSLSFDASFITIPSGYVILGFMGVSTNNDRVVPRSWRYNGDLSYQYSFEIQNFNSSTISKDFVVYVLFARADLVTFDIS